ncbi:hypothetical protein [Propionivibrio dicarboxylicus]|uniref:Uncharacterized protein n=1 Tax=Propionivibrio dicarboxylicus TaxID=83767 RepID=A0A1G8AQC8_9RHOO|nr:hypothetical protein [Propionivibrio dicarboxylicus]SDH23201.1 hypothetical protein SAMN05660652_01464 [Propionivibrio dicarboxylicus]
MIETTETLLANTENAIANWNLGPAVVDQPGDPYWDKAAQVFGVSLAEAKRRICANCEYYDNTPERLTELETIPLNKFDIYGSQAHRGYCHKLHIICHTTRSCQAWERKDYEIPDDLAPPRDARAMYPNSDMA